MKSSKLFAAFASCCLLSLADAAPSTYEGQEQRVIKALSAEDAQALLDGKGMGLAKAAELNGYPGPAHVLQHADALKLTSNQREKTEALFRAMEATAKPIGAALVEAERELDQLFLRQLATPDLVRSKLSRIGELQAQVRSAHLEVHIAQAALMHPEQIAEYNRLRGYSAADGASAVPRIHRH